MKTKYPRSWHLHYSEKLSSDDRQHHDDNHFHGKNVIVSIKMDGENTTIYNETSHARSTDSQVDSEDRRWVEALRKSKIEGNIPDSLRICGENMFYRHTCKYDDIDSMFYVFSIWDVSTCLSWKDTKIWCDLLGLVTVPIIYEGLYDRDMILSRFKEYISNNNDVEGFVIRNQEEFEIEEFSTSLSKYVRKTFVIPSQHWRYSVKTLNQLKNNRNPWETI